MRLCVFEKPRSDKYILLYIVCSRGEEFLWGPIAHASLILGLAAVAPLRRGGQMAKKKSKKTELQGDDTTMG